MRQKYRMFLRGTVYWVQDNVTGKQESLGTKDRTEAGRLFNAKNEASRQPIINMQIARAYLLVGDPEVAKRTWQFVMEEIVKLKHDETRRRWLVAIKDKALDRLRVLSLMETRAEHFLRAMEKGKVSTNIYLRRIHNFALGMNWLPVPVIPKRMWPTFSFKDKRAITLKEHQAIIARETNGERRAFYELAWHIGASQSDIAFLDAENVDWENQVISYERKKSGEQAFIRFGKDVERILSDLPSTGSLFPYLRTVRAGHRATEFRQGCRRANISGPSTFSAADITNLELLVKRLREKSDAVSEWLGEKLADTIDAPYFLTKTNAHELRENLATALNRIIASGDLSKADAFRDVERRLETTEVERKSPTGIALQRLNRMILEDAHPRELSRNRIPEVTLHSYRYAWAERARKSGYPERFAQEALGHNSKAVHRAYARKAKVIIPTLESYENQSSDNVVVPLPQVPLAKAADCVKPNSQSTMRQ
jgi:hypothetical protein